VSDWHWECEPENLLDGLPREALRAVSELAREITVRDSIVFPEGRDFTGDTPGLRMEERGPLLLTYLTDVRGEVVVVVQVAWFG
jgi:hypothetical protein